MPQKSAEMPFQVSCGARPMMAQKQMKIGRNMDCERSLANETASNGSIAGAEAMSAETWNFIVVVAAICSGLLFSGAISLFIIADCLQDILKELRKR